MNIIEAKTARVLPTRVRKINCVILHTTGESNHEKILRFYRSADGLQPHWYITTDGVAYLIVEENKIAYHTKIDQAEASLYEQGFSKWSRWRWMEGKPVRVQETPPAYLYWRKRWPDLSSPIDLPSGKFPNSVSVGIELQNPSVKLPHVFTDAQYATAKELVDAICARWSLTKTKSTVFSHADCSPMRRSTLNAPWDLPPNFDWSRVL